MFCMIIWLYPNFVVNSGSIFSFFTRNTFAPAEKITCLCNFFCITLQAYSNYKLLMLYG